MLSCGSVRAAIAASLLLLAPSAQAQLIFDGLKAATTQITPETVRAIEQQMEMPPDAHALIDYDRYYAAAVLNDRDVVVGVYLQKPLRAFDGARAVDGVADAFTVPFDKLPFVNDGGCSVISLYFNLTTGKLIRIRRPGMEPAYGVCNGIAG